MRVKGMFILVLMASLVLVFNAPAWCEMSNAELLQELKLLKERVKQLEAAIQQQNIAVQEKPSREEFTRIRSEDERISKELENLGEKHEEMKGILDEIAERVTVSGVVEIEAAYSSVELKDGNDDENTSDITLATAQIEFGARIHEYVNAHLVLLWEEDDTEPVDIDEGTITLGATENFPFYLLAGRFYPLYGEFNSYFISDPLTLEIGETQESAVAVGYVGPWAYLGVGAFNGDITENENDRINSWWVHAQVYNPEGTLGPFQVKLGASYFNNLSDSDTISEHIPDGQLEDLVAGFSIFGIVDVGPVSFSAEYLGALDDYNAGDLDFAVLNGEEKSAQPRAWNVELAYGFLEKFQVACKYERSTDMYSLFPETRYGGVFGWEIFPNTTWSIEYLHGEYDANDDQLDRENVFTSQLALEF